MERPNDASLVRDRDLVLSTRHGHLTDMDTEPISDRGHRLQVFHTMLPQRKLNQTGTSIASPIASPIDSMTTAGVVAVCPLPPLSLDAFSTFSAFSSFAALTALTALTTFPTLPAFPAPPLGRFVQHDDSIIPRGRPKVPTCTEKKGLPW